jgi:hypothetical protein
VCRICGEQITEHDEVVHLACAGRATGQ